MIPPEFRACQLAGKRTNVHHVVVRAPKLGCNTSCLTPYGRGFASESSVIDGRDEVATGVEGVVDGTVGLEKPLS